MYSKYGSVKCVASHWTALVLVANFAACVDDSVAPAPEATRPAQPRVLGFVELTFDGIGTPDLSSSMIAAPTIAALEEQRAERERSRDLRDIVALDLTRPANADNSGNGTIQLLLDEQSEFVFDGIRYLRATYLVRNAQSNEAAHDTERTNLTFLAVSTNNAVNQTAVRRFLLGGGAPAPPALALDVLPTDLMTTDGTTLTVAHPDVLQVLREAEVAAVAAPPAVTTVFPYGFVVRLVGSNTTRTLPASPAAGNFAGQIDFAFSIPLQAAPADDPESLTVLMLAVDDSETRLTQGPQEQSPSDQSDLEALATSLGADTVTLVPGGGLPGFSGGLRTLCAVRTGGSSGAASGFLVNADWSNVSFSPNPGSVIPATTSFQATFDTAVYGIGANNFTVTGSLSGQAFTDTTYSGNGTNTITTPQGSFLPGEEVEIALLGPCPQPEIATYQVEGDFGLQRVASGLTFPIFVTHAPGDSGRLFIAERGGTIRILDLNTGVLEPTTFLTMAGISTQGEGGFLGLAFHPDYNSEGMPGHRKFFVNVTTDNTTISHIREFEVSADPSVADPGSLRQILSFSQPQANHNGGWIGFSPNDGYLYIATGDGGGSNDNASGHTSDIGNAQDTTNNLLGKMLRIDVNGDDFPGDPDRNYAIPSTNPFVGMTGDDELWAYGLRNPFRASFDRLTGDLWIGDVGQSAREEIDFQPASSTGGENYGWRLREGTIATPSGGVGGPPPAGNVDPVYDYDRSTGPFGGTIVTGGYVYRGPDPSLQGIYFFLDSRSSSGTADDNYWMFDPVDPLGTVTNIDSLLTPDTGSAEFPVSFGEDAVGNLYIAYLTSGEVYRIVLQTVN